MSLFGPVGLGRVKLISVYAWPAIAGSMCCLSLLGPLFGPGGPAECGQADKCSVLPIVAGFLRTVIAGLSAVVGDTLKVVQLINTSLPCMAGSF